MAPISELFPYFAAFGAALAGSLHCAGMCGPLRLLCNNIAGARWKYQMGRGMAYAFLGTIAGGIGFILPLWALLVLVLIGLAGTFLNLQALPNLALVRRNLLRLGSTSPFFLGLSSGLLPCGLLHGWLAAAAASGQPMRGGILLFMLWAGSLPALEASPFFLKKPLEKLNRRFPMVVKISFLGIALLPLLMRLPSKENLPLLAPAGHCHSNAIAPIIKATQDFQQ